jgi:preprotein translocase subunit SecA
VERLYNAQRQLVTRLLAEAKELLKGWGTNRPQGKDRWSEAGMALLRAHRGLPKNSALIKFLSETGVRAHLQKTENDYLQEARHAEGGCRAVLHHRREAAQHRALREGVDLISGDVNDEHFFIMPDVGGTMVPTSSERREPWRRRPVARTSCCATSAIKSERIHTVNQLMRAYALYEKDVEYVVMDGKVKIVDEQTGRILEGRRYSDGLHQAIESKEKREGGGGHADLRHHHPAELLPHVPQAGGHDRYGRDGGQEFWDIYKLDVMVIPTNRPVVRKDNEDMVFKTKREKYNAVIDEIDELRKQAARCWWAPPAWR